MVSINFSYRMDTVSVEEVLTILPDTIGITKTWFNSNNLSLYVPYWRLAEIPLLQVKIGTSAIDIYDDTLSRELSVFYPVDTGFVRRQYLQ